jgi:hypothetical protein
LYCLQLQVVESARNCDGLGCSLSIDRLDQDHDIAYVNP